MTHQICDNSYASKNVAWFTIISQFWYPLSKLKTFLLLLIETYWTMPTSNIHNFLTHYYNFYFAPYDNVNVIMKCLDLNLRFCLDVCFFWPQIYIKLHFSAFAIFDRMYNAVFWTCKKKVYVFGFVTIIILTCTISFTYNYVLINNFFIRSYCLQKHSQYEFDHLKGSHQT